MDLLAERFKLYAQDLRNTLDARSEPEKSGWADPIVDVPDFGKWVEDQIAYLKV